MTQGQTDRYVNKRGRAGWRGGTGWLAGGGGGGGGRVGRRDDVWVIFTKLYIKTLLFK